ncbi:MAG: hypothetical protein A2V78_09750 [Betaproteobacteria bacterium RBG_16_64_18]|nr:MAG: hypothetical protein A2V78_09750 [Betaproteobacteria bacterium RBG_16_64_18]OGA07170.1 MAG: hypothetical protein A3H33_02240 [Betaproteobacteria bacterium RIFCSPLOWO2_02_FULL_65_20]OGA37693.1 MAG: hypothetical protein A3G26_10740 [Betaproteobacteria bacterium RIFCSPLOWO2_12_FULL_65_110]
MTIHDFQQWLDRYGDAWVAGDPDAAVQLFSSDAAYYETPFDEPMFGLRGSNCRCPVHDFLLHPTAVSCARAGERARPWASGDRPCH